MARLHKRHRGRIIVDGRHCNRYKYRCLVFYRPEDQFGFGSGGYRQGPEQGDSIFVPSITIVELAYLLEKNRVPVDVIDKLREAPDDESTSFRLAELTRGVADDVQRIDRSTVGDMPDRIIAATALHLGLPLITSDGNIQKLTNVTTIW